MEPKYSFPAAKLFVAAATLFACGMSYAAHDPIILMTGASGDLTKVQPIKDYLVSKGWAANRIFLWKDSSGFQGDVPTTAKELSAEVNTVLSSTGAAKVVLITWSSSTISGRYYVKYLGGTDKVSQFVSYAGPHHGITNYAACQYLWKACAQWGPIPLTQFMLDLNSGTEVPGSPTVKYLTLRGSADTNASPVDTALLAGADEQDLFNGLTHYTLLTDANVQAKLSNFLIAHESTGGGSTTTTTLGGTTTTTAATTTTTTVATACYTASNSAHVSAGRAIDMGGSAYAKGTYQYMGFDNVFVTTSLKQTGSNYYVVANCN